MRLTSGVCPDPELTVVLVHHGDRGLLRRCLESLDTNRSQSRLELVVVDNDYLGTEGPTSPAVFGGVLPARWIRNRANRGFAVAANQGAALATAPLLLFLNTDVRLPAGALREMLDAMHADPGLAALAPMTVPSAVASIGTAAPRDPRRRFLGPFSQAAGLLGLARGRRPGGGVSRADQRGACEMVGPFWLEACALVVRRTALRAVGGFDEGYFFYEEDEDLCWRLQRRGYRLAVCGDVHVEHEGGASARSAGGWPVREFYRGQVRFVVRRCGWPFGLVYRVSVTLAVLIRSCRRRHRRSLVRVLEGLWTLPAAVSTKAV